MQRFGCVFLGLISSDQLFNSINNHGKLLVVSFLQSLIFRARSRFVSISRRNWTKVRIFAISLGRQVANAGRSRAWQPLAQQRREGDIWNADRALRSRFVTLNPGQEWKPKRNAPPVAAKRSAEPVPPEPPGLRGGVSPSPDASKRGARPCQGKAV